MKKYKIDYLDTLDLADSIMQELQDLGHIKSDDDLDIDNDEGINFFEIQDAIQHKINKMLNIDIDTTEFGTWSYSENQKLPTYKHCEETKKLIKIQN